MLPVLVTVFVCLSVTMDDFTRSRQRARRLIARHTGRTDVARADPMAIQPDALSVATREATAAAAAARSAVSAAASTAAASAAEEAALSLASAATASNTAVFSDFVDDNFDVFHQSQNPIDVDMSEIPPLIPLSPIPPMSQPPAMELEEKKSDDTDITRAMLFVRNILYPARKLVRDATEAQYHPNLFLQIMSSTDHDMTCMFCDLLFEYLQLHEQRKVIPDALYIQWYNKLYHSLVRFVSLFKKLLSDYTLSAQKVAL